MFEFIILLIKSLLGIKPQEWALVVCWSTTDKIQVIDGLTYEEAQRKNLEDEIYFGECTELAKVNKGSISVDIWGVEYDLYKDRTGEWMNKATNQEPVWFAF